MAAFFRRTVSFPVVTAAAKRSGFKIRCLSLPVRFHPIVSDLNYDVATLISWSGSIIPYPSPMWLLEGTQHIFTVLSSLLHVMDHPLALDQLRESPSTNSIAEDVLYLLDSLDLFRVALIYLNRLQANTRVTLIRRDPSRVAVAIKEQNRAARDLVKLASAAQKAARTTPDVTEVNTLPIAMYNAIIALASASSVVFIGLSALSDQSTALATPMATGPEKSPVCIEVKWIVCALKKWRMKVLKDRPAKEVNKEEEKERARKAAIANLDMLEDCIKEMEKNIEKVYRHLVTARVILLNMMSYALT